MYNSSHDKNVCTAPLRTRMSVQLLSGQECLYSSSLDKNVYTAPLQTRMSVQLLSRQECMYSSSLPGQECIYSSSQDKNILTGSTSQMTRLLSLDPVASLVPSGEKRQNQTSSQWSFRTWTVVEGKSSLKQQVNIYKKRNFGLEPKCNKNHLIDHIDYYTGENM
jgi:hypothetical protein